MKLEEKVRGKAAVLVVAAFLIYILLNYGKDIMGILGKIYGLFSPFILGACIAFILNIPVTFFEQRFSKCKAKGVGKIIRKHNVAISILISCLLILGALVLILFIIIPNIVDTIKILPTTFNNSEIAFQKFLDGNTWLSKNVMSLVNSMNLDWNGILAKVKNIVFSGASSILMSTLGAVTTLASTAVEFVIAFVFSIYILAQKNKLGVQVKKVMYAFLKKEKVDYILEILKLTSNTFSSFITGQCTVSSILGIIFFVVMIILKLPYAIVVSIIIGVFSIIPMIGSIIGFVLSVLLIVIANPIKAVIFIVVYAVIKQLEDNLIYPKVVGNSVGLPSILVLMAIILGDKVLGVAGMIIAIPLFSVAYVLLRKEVNARLKEKSIKIE